MKGESFDEARENIITQVDKNKLDEITLNIFEDEKSYINSYTYFTKRPLYPFTANLLNILSFSEYYSFLIPVFLSYMGVIILVYYLAKEGLNYFFAIITTALFTAFYPFLDWSTYFLTDTIGALFWLIQIPFLYKYIVKKQDKYILLYAVVLIISLFNREQSTLMLPLLIIMLLLILLFDMKHRYAKPVIIAIKSTFIIIGLYLIILFVTNQRSIIDTILYTQNNYGLSSYNYSLTQSLNWVISQIVLGHKAFISDLIRHHWWSLFALIGLIGIIKTLYSFKRIKIIDILLICSAVASYSAFFIYPVLSYRFFFPVLLTLIYFSLKTIKEYFEYK